MALKIHRPPEDEPPTRPLRGNQFSLQTLFIVSTFLSFVMAGYVRVGLEGASGMLFGAWLATIGIYLLLSAYRESNPRLGAAVAGGGMLLLGLAAFFAIAMAGRKEATERSWGLGLNPIVLLGLGFVCYVIWDLSHVKWDITFVVTPDGIIRNEGIPEKKLADIREFFQKTDLANATSKGIKIRAKRDKHGNLVVRCLGDVTRAEHQRIRNFLVDTL